MQSDVLALNSSSTDVLEIYKSALEAAGVGFTIGDASRPGFPLIYANPTFESLTGYKVEEILGRNCSFLQGNDTEQPNLQILRQALHDGVACTVVLRNYHKDGSLFWNHLSLTPVRDDTGQLTHFVAIQTDVSELKRAQEEALKAEQLRIEIEKEREIIALKERFTSVVSHEFRTPLTVIRTSVEIIERYFERLSDDKKREHLAKINSQALYMNALMDDVLMFSKGQAGKTEFQPKPLDLALFCRRLIDDLHVTDQGVHLILFTLSDEIGTVQMDEKLLQHILVNLLSNALKYSPPKTQVRLDLQVEQNVVYFRISDEGMGIPKEDQPHLFEPFHRAQNALQIEGTGLGLAIVKNNVQRHGGKISCESVMGQGTTFTIRLPLVRDDKKDLPD